MTEPIPPHDSFDPEPLLARIAAIEPVPDATRRALARVQAALPSAERSPVRGASFLRWPVAVAIAATIVLALGISLALLPRHLSPKELLASTLKATQDYKGWIHITYGGDNFSYHWNSQTHAFVDQYQYLPQDKSAAVNHVDFLEPASKSRFAYNSDSNTIRITTYGSEPPNPPTALSQILDGLHDAIGHNTGIGETSDRGMQRLDIPPAPPATPTTQIQPNPSSGPPAPLQPSAVWFDPQSMLIRIVRIANTEINFSYGGPEFNTIYDAGAPQGARVLDQRASASENVVLDRLDFRLNQLPPDGIFATLTTSAEANRLSELTLYDRTGARWTRRNYAITPLVGKFDQTMLRLPDHWQDINVEEFFRRVTAAVPTSHEGGDATHAWTADLDASGHEFSSTAIITTDDKGNNTFSVNRADGPRQATGFEAREMTRLANPLRDLYPSQDLDQPGTRKIITSPDHPGLLCLHVVYTQNGIPKNGVPGTLRMISQQWFDPSHDDRPVSFQRLTFVGNSRQIEAHQVTDFSAYLSFPEPDGRSYPTLRSENTYNTDGTIVSASTTEYRFFPNRHLPDIPKTSNK